MEVDFSFSNYFPILCFSRVEQKELLISLPVFVRELKQNDGFEVPDLLGWIIVHETCHALEDDGSSKFEAV